MKIETITDLITWRDEIALGAEMFRGQSVSSWPLLPSIKRYSNLIKFGYDAIAHVEEYLIEDFEKYTVPFVDMRGLSYVEKLVHAQHHGLPTRLLDWSTNPLKALFFAVEDVSYDLDDGVIIGFSPTDWLVSTKSVDLGEKLTSFYPEHLNDRLAAQEGCFTSFPLENEIGFEVNELSKENYPDETDVFYTCIIPAKFKQRLRIQLSEFGINHRTLFPGLDGIAKWIKASHSNHLIK
jgi:FRG domain